MKHYIRPARDKHAKEFRALMHLRMGCLLSKEQNPMNDANVKARAEKLLVLLRQNAPSLHFTDDFIRSAGHLGETFGMQISQDLTTCTIFRLDVSNVVSINKFNREAS